MPALFTVPGIVSGRFLGLILNILIFIVVWIFIRNPKPVHIRRVPGLDAIDEAVGRCAEMGKPFVFSPGIASSFGYWTVAALSVMGHVAKLCVRSGTRFIVPLGGADGVAIVREVAADIVKSAYTLEGRPEDFTMDDLPFLSGQQFAYAGGFVGILQRVRPGATILLGGMAEAMSICEVSNAVGAITISAGSYISNLAVLACASDYILIGEEEPAAGAYLSDNPRQRYSIRVQDYSKWIIIAMVIIGIIFVNMGNPFFKNLLAT
ncbi:hypothetical protein FJY84_02110 [Candidatus Bathyarchaeota archaeon]|nr:hypothetical protein [Candidatus Bathyarchaeota archaeon]